MGKKLPEIEIVKGDLPRKRDQTVYEWENTPKKQIEPWHLTSIALLLDVLVLAFYMFVDCTRTQLLILGYTSHFISILLIGISYLMLKNTQKKWTQPVIKFSSMINLTACFITAAITLLTIMFT